MGEVEKRRKSLFVNRTVQGRVLWHVAVYWILYHALLWHVLFLSEGMQGRTAGSFRELYANFFAENVILLCCAIAVFPIVLVDAVKLTHRIVGPLRSFERVLRDMTDHKPVAKLNLRKRDLLSGFLEVFNDFIESQNREIEVRAGRRNVDAAVGGPSSGT